MTKPIDALSDFVSYVVISHLRAVNPPAVPGMVSLDASRDAGRKGSSAIYRGMVVGRRPAAVIGELLLTHRVTGVGGGSAAASVGRTALAAVS